MSTNSDLKVKYPRIDDPTAAILFALSNAHQRWAIDFLETWHDGAWDELATAYPEFLTLVEAEK